MDLIVSVLGNTTQNHDRKEKPGVGRNASHAPSQQSRGVFKVVKKVDCVRSLKRPNFASRSCMCLKATKQ